MGNRNSYSKTDPEATFMRMKDDYMKNGQLKAGYNLQIATQGQFTLAFDVFSNPTDTRTFQPFLHTIRERFFELPEYIVADAGYGSEENYQEIIDHFERTPLMPYGMYEKEKKKKFKNDIFRPANWDYLEEDDVFVCPNKKKLLFKRYSIRTDKYGFERNFKLYECEDCTGCPLRSQCTQAKSDKPRMIQKNMNWEYFKAYTSKKLSDEKTGAIYRQRKIDVEPVFGFLKANLGFTRMSVRGKSKVRNELGIALMAVNMRKITAQGVASLHIKAKNLCQEIFSYFLHKFCCIVASFYTKTNKGKMQKKATLSEG
jgi:transposase